MSVSSRNATPPVPEAQRKLRLRLRPADSSTGYVDGGWWPRSRDLAAELPALATVLAVRLGSVWRVVYALDSWDAAPRRIQLDGHPIRLEGFHSQDKNVISVVSADRRRIRLLVVSPAADDTAGHEALMASAGRDNTDRPVEILAAAGIRPNVRMPEPRDNGNSRHPQQAGAAPPA